LVSCQYLIVGTLMLIDTWDSVYGVFMEVYDSTLGRFVISGLNTSKIHKNYNFYWKMIIPPRFDLWDMRTLLKNMYPSWSLPQHSQIANQGSDKLVYFGTSHRSKKWRFWGYPPCYTGWLHWGIKPTMIHENGHLHNHATWVCFLLFVWHSCANQTFYNSPYIIPSLQVVSKFYPVIYRHPYSSTKLHIIIRSSGF